MGRRNVTRVETKVIAIPSCGIAADTTCSVLRKTGSWWLRAWDTSTVDRATVEVMLDRLHAAQNAFYSGGDDQKLRALLDPDIIWTVPGSSPIAGRYHGIDEVFAYFAHRRDRAAGTFRMHRRDVLAGEGARIAALTDGTASIAGAQHTWSTVGLYETVDARRISACWLLPLDQAAFDAIWSR